MIRVIHTSNALQRGEEKHWRASVQGHDDSTAHEQAEEWMEIRREANRSFHRLADRLSGAQLSSSERLQSLRSVDALQNCHVESAMLSGQCAAVSVGVSALLIAFLGCCEACAFARQSPLRCSPSYIHLSGPHYYPLQNHSD